MVKETVWRNRILRDTIKWFLDDMEHGIRIHTYTGVLMLVEQVLGLTAREDLNSQVDLGKESTKEIFFLHRSKREVWQRKWDV